MMDADRLADLRRRVDADPSSIAFAQLAEEYRRAGDYAEAERVCRAGLHHHPAYASARVTLGRTLLQVGRIAEAQLEFERVLSLAPDNLAAVRALAEIHHRRGELIEALAWFERARPPARQDPEIERIIARLRAELPPVPAPATPTNFDDVLQAMGFEGHRTPPAVEALIADGSALQAESPVGPPAEPLPLRTAAADRRALEELERWLAVLRAGETAS